MTKFFCDHCGKEMGGLWNTLEDPDLFWDTDKKEYVGTGCILCDQCYELREKTHLELDMKFLNLSDKFQGEADNAGA